MRQRGVSILGVRQGVQNQTGDVVLSRRGRSETPSAALLWPLEESPCRSTEIERSISSCKRGRGNVHRLRRHGHRGRRCRPNHFHHVALKVAESPNHSPRSASPHRTVAVRSGHEFHFLLKSVVTFDYTASFGGRRIEKSNTACDRVLARVGVADCGRFRGCARRVVSATSLEGRRRDQQPAASVGARRSVRRSKRRPRDSRVPKGRDRIRRPDPDALRRHVPIHLGQPSSTPGPN